MTNGSTSDSMASFEKIGRFEGIAALEAYWQALRGHRTVPLRSDVDPRGIEAALDYAFIVERVSPGVARFRLAGTQISELLGMDVRGMPLTSLFGVNARSEMTGAIDAVFDGPEILEVGLVSPEGAGREALLAQMILLPLKSDLGDISRALGCFPTRGPMGRAPRRFDLAAAIKRTPLGSAVRTGGYDQPRRAESLIGMAEEQAKFMTPDRANPAERPYLRLVRDDDETSQT